MTSFVEKLRRLSGGAEKDAETTSSPRTNVWSSTFDPNANANLRKVGASYYDKPIDNKTVWDQHLASEGAAKSDKSTPVSSPPNPGLVDPEELRKMLSSSRVESAMKQAQETGGKVDFDRFMEILRRD